MKSHGFHIVAAHQQTDLSIEALIGQITLRYSLMHIYN